MKLPLVLVFLLLSSVGFAQVNVGGGQRAERFDKNVYGLGFTVGPASGIGVSFRNHLPSKLSYQLAGGIIRSGGKVSASLGAEGQFDLVRGNLTRFFAAAGMGYFYIGEGKNTVDAPFRLGVGLGGEVQVKEGFHLSAEGMFVYYSDGNILPLPQVALHYYFY